MTEQMPQDPLPSPPNKRTFRNAMLISLGAIFFLSCFGCGVLFYFLFQPGKPVPPVTFMDEHTAGIVVLRLDISETKTREFFTSALEIASRRHRESESLQEVKNFMESGEVAPPLTALFSYRTEHDEVTSFGVLSFSELQWMMRLFIGWSYNAMAHVAEGRPYRGAMIVEGSKAFAEDEEIANPFKHITTLASYQYSVFDSSLFAGSRIEDVESAINAYASVPIQIDRDTPFLNAFREIDKNVLAYGVLKNGEGNPAIAAFFPEERAKKARGDIQDILALDPRQIELLCFTLDLLNDNQAELKLIIKTANSIAAEQVKIAVESFGRHEHAEDIPLLFEAVTGEIEDNIYRGTIHISGIRDLVSFLMPEDKAAEETEDEAEEEI